MLIESIQEDLLVNNGEYDIVKDCSNELVKMAKEEYTEIKWIIDLLESYSYKIIDILELERDLEDIKEYCSPNKDAITLQFDTVINAIKKGGNE